MQDTVRKSWGALCECGERESAHPTTGCDVFYKMSDRIMDIAIRAQERSAQ